MVESKIKLLILTPYGRYFEGDVDFLGVRSSNYTLGILPNHTPLVSTLIISKMVIRMGGKEYNYAIGGGVINIDKEKTTLILDSCERSDEIDVERAKQAKRRAEERLERAKKDETIDVARAQVALMKALNRIDISSID